MSRSLTSAVCTLFVVAIAAQATPNISGEPITPYNLEMTEQSAPAVNFEKADYYAAIEAYESGNVTELQMQILESSGYFHEPPAITYTGGPDAFGYEYHDSYEPDGPQYSWIDVTPFGTQVYLGDDDNSGPIGLPFAFTYYGINYYNIYIQSNGAITVSDVIVSYMNDWLPTSYYTDLIAPLWTDFDPTAGGEIWYGFTMVNGHYSCIVSFIDVPHFENIGTATFQVILQSGGTILFQYDSASTLISQFESIGIQINDNCGLNISQGWNPPDYPPENFAIEMTFEWPGNNAVLSGHVLDGATYAPLENAEIIISGIHTFTDADGYYEFVTDLLPPDNYIIQVVKDEYYTIRRWFSIYEGPNGYNANMTHMPPPITYPFFTDFETDPGWLEPISDDWMYGSPTTNPNGAYSGDYCWDLVLNGNYSPNSVDWLISTQRFQVPLDGSFDLSYYHWYSIEIDHDGYALTVSSDKTWFYFIPPYGGYPGQSDGIPNCFNGSTNGWQHPSFDLTAWAGESVFIGFVFDSNDTGILFPGVAIDDLMIGPYINPPPPVEFWIIPYGTHDLPPHGGVLTYDAHLINNTGNFWNNLLYWTEVELPNGNMHGPIVDAPFSILPYMNVVAMGQTQAIPGFAPAGTYMFFANVGRRPGPHLTGAFDFSKQSTIAISADGPTHWNGSKPAWLNAATAATPELPTEYEMAKVYPNPFNPTANVSIALPETAKLKVAVFNIMGQQVAELANGTFSAGVQTFTIDGSNLTSGIYFVRATVPGHLNQVQKVMLVR